MSILPLSADDDQTDPIVDEPQFTYGDCGHYLLIVLRGIAITFGTYSVEHPGAERIALDDALHAKYSNGLSLSSKFLLNRSNRINRSDILLRVTRDFPRKQYGRRGPENIKPDKRGRK